MRIVLNLDANDIQNLYSGFLAGDLQISEERAKKLLKSRALKRYLTEELQNIITEEVLQGDNSINIDNCSDEMSRFIMRDYDGDDYDAP